MSNYFIFQDGKLMKTFNDQESDTKVFGWMLGNQGCSVSRALSVEGWHIEELDQKTGVVTNYRTGGEISNPLCKNIR